MSIKPTELRIGNIFWENYGGYKEVVGIFYSQYEGHVIHATGIGYKAIGEYSLKDCYPIPLSPEVLLACGFEREERSYYGGDTFRVWFKDGIDIHENWNATEFMYATYVKGAESSFKAGVKVSTLHHLQNIYFDLTGGTELTYKP